jgi:hypothetical protein
MTRDVVEATVDGRVVELGEVDFAMYGDAVGGFDHPGFRFAVWWRGRLPQGARSITLRGRVPLRVGVGGRLEEFPCATGPAGMRFEAAHNRWKIGEVQPLPSGRRVALDLDGAGGHVAVGFMDSTGRPIPTGQFTGSGGGIGGRSWSSGRVWVAPEPQIAAVRITSFERAETRSFPIDVTGQVVPGVLSPSLASERE